LETVVHSDDLAVSVGAEPPDLPGAVTEPVVDLLVRLSLRRHGTTNVLRALSRAERAPRRIAALCAPHPGGGPVPVCRRQPVATPAAKDETGRMMKLGFSTLGCPAYDLDQIIALARTGGYDGVELRFVAGEVQLETLPEFALEALPETRKRFEDAGLEVACV